jgi:hypothetical protein
MIDTDKYEGHTEGAWHWDFFCLYNAIGKELVQVLGEPCNVELVGEDWDDDTPTQQLIADAPLLLEEVKRLRDFIQSVWDGLGEAGRNEHYELFKEYMGDD